MEIFGNDFLGNILVMIIGLGILGTGAWVFVEGAYASVFNYAIMIALMAVGLVLIAFGLRLLLDLIDQIKPGMRRKAR